MAKQTQYVQCILKKDTKLQTRWIPERYAVMGKYLKLQENGIWENAWQVISIGVKVSKNSLDILSQEYKKTRTASNI